MTSPEGIWMVYDHDYGPYVISVHTNAEQAARKAAQQGYGKVGYWPFGVELGEAVNVWEGREKS